MMHPVLAKAYEILQKPDPPARDQNIVAAADAFIQCSRQRSDEREEQRWRENGTRSDAQKSVINIVDTTLERAQELCRLAWKDSPYERSSNTGFPNICGNCEGKSLWLQKHLGGVVMVGWRTDMKDKSTHAALVLPIAGKLYVADHGEVVPLADYAFVYTGVYQK